VTDIDVYQPAAVAGYQPGMIMTPDAAKALDEQVRLCTAAVLREGTDYGVIPGTSGEKSLWRPGAQKLLQWFGLGYTCDRVEVERDDDGRKHGITYRCVVARRLPDGSLDIKATCEGTADYDESKFYQSAEEVQHKAEAKERMWAEKDRRVANPTKWKNLGEYRADWNALMKRAQKRAIVGAVVDATAAGGIFADREEDESPAPQDDGPGWYEQALEAALTFTGVETGRQLYVDAAQAARDGLCTPRQANHVQNRINQRVKLLKTATPVDVEDLGRDAETAAAGDGTRSQRPSGTETPRPAADEHGAGTAPATAGGAPSRDAQQLPPLPGEDEPGSVSPAQLTKLHTVLTGLGFNGEDREQKLVIAEVITGHNPLTGPEEGRTSKNLSLTEARSLIDTLNGFADRDALIAYMAGQEQAGGGDD
jgi:hypothetical protein